MISDNLWTGPNLRLTGLERFDARAFSMWHNDAGFLRLLDAEYARPRSEDECVKWFEDWQRDAKMIAFAVRPLAADDLVGVVMLESILFQHGVAWLGMGFGNREQWGKGYGREAMSLILRYAFSELNFHRVQASVFEYNTLSIGMCERAGFRREGVFREFLLRDGRRYDMYLYGVLRAEWAALNGGGEDIG